MNSVLDRNTILNTLRQHKKYMESLGVLKIGLFGSYAVNQETSTSDLDFIVDLAEHDHLYSNYCRLKYFLEDLFHKEIDHGLFQSLSLRHHLCAILYKKER